MYHSRKFHLSKYIFWKRQNIFRWLELVLSSGCLTLAIILYQTPLYMTTKIILLVVNTNFFFVTIVDVISWIQLKPMGYKTWILFATAAYLTLWLCGGLLVFVKDKTQTLMYACPLYFATGVVYLLDCLWVVIEYISWVKGHKVAPIRNFTDRAVSTCYLFEEVPYEKSHPIKTRSKYPIVVKPRNIVTVSYGGTFPVSKNETPLPSPDTKSISGFSINSSAQSWRRSSVSISSRGRPFGDGPKKDFRLHSKPSLPDQKKKTTDDQEISVIRPIRSKPRINTVIDPFSARISEPSTVFSQDLLSEKPSKDSLQNSGGSSPRENVTQRKYRSLSSRSHPCNTRIRSTLSRMSARTLKDFPEQSLPENPPRDSQRYHPMSCRPPFTEPLNVGMSKPSTGHSLERISEKTSGDSVLSHVELSRQQQLMEPQGRGSQHCACPLVTSSNYYEEVRSHNSTVNEELTKHTIWEEPTTAPTMQRKTSFPVRDLLDAPSDTEQYVCAKCGKICQYNSQQLINVLPLYCKCSSSKKDRPPGQKPSHVDNLDHALRPTKPDSELGQYYPENAGKRNGLDPEDHMKRRSRQHHNMLYQTSLCREPKCNQEYFPPVTTPRHLEKPTVREPSPAAQITQKSPRAKPQQREESTATEASQHTQHDPSLYQVDQGVSATKQLVDHNVQAHLVHKDEAVQVESHIKPLTPDVTVSVQTIPAVLDDMLASINYIPPIKHYKPGTIHAKNVETENVEEGHKPGTIHAKNVETEIVEELPILAEIEDAIVKKEVEPLQSTNQANRTPPEDAVIQGDEKEILTVESPETVEKESIVSKESQAVACACDLNSENKRAVTMEDIFNLLYQPCYRPPVCPICFEQTRMMLDAQRFRGRSVETGINTDQSEDEQKKRHSLFKKKKK